MSNYNRNKGSQNNRDQGYTRPRPQPQRYDNGGAQVSKQADSPYAFVPFPAAAPDRSDLNKVYANPEDLMSGWFDVTLTAKTELLMPDGSKEKKEGDHKTMPFYTTPDGQPAVPGSELRGMLRSVYETASNSCLPFVLNNKQTSMRLPTYAALKSRGLLERVDGEWQLWSAWDYSLRADQFSDRDDLKSGNFRGHVVGEHVGVKKQGNKYVLTNEPGAEEGYLQFSSPVVWPKPGMDGKKNYYHVHVLAKKSLLYTWMDDTPFEALKEELTREGARERMRDFAEAVHKGLLKVLKEAKKNNAGCVPVFFLETESEGEKIYYLAASSIGRINQIRKWEDIMGQYGPCTSREQCCPACQLFGNIQGDTLIRGRVRMTDALPENKIQLLPYRTLPILGGPKPTAFEYYIRKPVQDAKFWNYDFYSTTVETEGGKGGEASFHQRDDFTPLGRKYYWHHATDGKTAPKGKLNVTTQPAPAGSRFKFRVYFDRITGEQYKQLIWTMTLGENSADSSLQHKLGHGRPLGYGSVKLIVEKATVRKLTMEQDQLHWTQEEKKVPEKMACPFSSAYRKTIESLLTVCSTKSSPKYKTSYPIGADKKGNVTIFNWFSKNRVVNQDHPCPDTIPAILNNATKREKAEFEEG